MQMTAAKTDAQRQADRTEREKAAGNVQFKRWIHPDDKPAMHEHADKLAKRRAKVKPINKGKSDE